MPGGLIRQGSKRRGVVKIVRASQWDKLLVRTPALQDGDLGEA